MHLPVHFGSDMGRTYCADAVQLWCKHTNIISLSPALIVLPEFSERHQWILRFINNVMLVVSVWLWEGMTACLGKSFLEYWLLLGLVLLMIELSMGLSFRLAHHENE